jgi:multiple sugar transport system substrate-binding protein
MRSERGHRLWALTVAMVLAVVGCGTGGSSSGGASSGSRSDSGPVNANYMKSGTYDVAAQQFAQQAKQQFGVTVNISAFPYAQLRQKNTTDLISGTCQTDIMSGSYYLAPQYQYFQPLDSYVKKDNYGQGLVPGIWQHSEFYNGQHIGIPYASNAYGLMYRTDLWQQAGLSWPKTWDELLADLKQLDTKYSGQGIAPFAFAGGAPEQLPGMFFASYDGYFLNKQGKYQLDQAKAERAIQYAQQLLALAPKNTMGLSIDQANQTFLQGNAAVLYGWPTFIHTDADSPDKSKVAGKWAVGVDPQPGFVWLSLWQMYMPKCSKHKDAAWKWMSYFSSPQNDKLMFKQYGIDGVYQSTYSDPELSKQMANYLPGEQANLSRAMNPPLSGEAQDYLASVLGDVFTGKTTASNAVKQINSKWTSLAVPTALQQQAKQNGLSQT